MENGLSIAICTFNSELRINKTLELFIYDLRLPFNWELIVIDNNSTDLTMSILKEYKEKILNMTIITEPKQGLAHARWRAIDNVKFSCLLFCDDDNVLNLNYLIRGFNHFKTNLKLGVLGGRGIPVFEKNKPVWFDHFQNAYAIGSLGRTSGKQQDMFKVYGAGLFFKTEALKKLKNLGFYNSLIGRSDKSLISGEDVELCAAVTILGYEYWYDDKMSFKHILHNNRLTWKYYLQLKRSIALSFPLIEAYRIKEYPNINEFRKYLWSRFFLALKSIVKISLSFKPNYFYEVGYVVNLAYLKSFLSNYSKAIKLYNYLKANIFSLNKI